MNRLTGMILVAILFAMTDLHGQSKSDSLFKEIDMDAIRLFFYDNDEEEIDENEMEALLEEYQYFQETPVNINGDNLNRLSDLGILNEVQIEQIQQYRKSFGDFFFSEELTMVDGLSPPLLSLLLPIIYIGQSSSDSLQNLVTVKKIVNKSRHQITLNTSRKLDDGSHYSDDDSLLLAQPGNYYLGSPWKWQVKYSYRYGDVIRCGLAMEKDAGEPFLLSRYSDTIQQRIRNHTQSGFDSYGFFLHVKDIKLKRKITREKELCIKDFVLGDYQLSFGQGLTMWSGMSMGKATANSSLMKRGAGVKPKASSGEGKFFRGIATTLRYSDIYLTMFFSSRHIDASAAVVDTAGEVEQVSTLLETGYHRCLNELEKRNTIQQRLYGGHLAYCTDRLLIGYTLYHYQLSAYLYPEESLYNQYYFKGNQLTNMGIDFSLNLDKTVIYGELSRSSNAAYAGLAGATWRPAGYADFSMAYRYYSRDYWCQYNASMGESSRRQGEQGLYLGLHATPLPHWDLAGYYDLFQIQWLSSQVYTPSWGHDACMTLTHSMSKTAELQLRVKTKKKMKNSSNDQVFSHYPICYTRSTFHAGISYQVAPGMIFSDKVEYVSYLTDESGKSHGGCISHSMKYNPEGSPLSVTLFYALFSSDDYDSRISTYESDVLGAFGLASLYGNGMRIYLLGRYKMLDQLSIYAKIGSTILFQDGIPIHITEGNLKIDFKGEVIWKF